MTCISGKLALAMNMTSLLMPYGNVPGWWRATGGTCDDEEVTQVRAAHAP